jgi:hypothetical protein
MSIFNPSFERGVIVVRWNSRKRMRALHQELEKQDSESEEIMFGLTIHVGELLSL